MTHWINRVKRCRAALINSAPIIAYFAEELIILGTDQLQGSGVTTAGVSKSGVTLFHEPFVKTLDDQELMFVIAHEALHWGLAIFERAENLNKDIANIAHDLVVNLLLSEIKAIKMPKEALYNEEYRKLSFEQVYKKINTEEKEEEGEEKSDENSGSGGSGGGDGGNDKNGGEISLTNDIDFTGHIDSLYASQIEYPLRDLKSDGKRRLDEVVQRIEEESKKSGGNNGSLLHRIAYEIYTINGIDKAPQKLFDNLPSFIGRYGRKEIPSKKRRHRRNRFDGTHIPYAGLRPAKSKLYLLIDTSGSMRYQDKIMKKVFGLILRLVTEFALELEIIQADTDVRFTSDGKQFLAEIVAGKVTLNGGGGSDFRSAFEFAIEDAALTNDGNLPLLALTDGFIYVPDKIRKVRADILWAGDIDSQAPTDDYGRHFIIQ